MAEYEVAEGGKWREGVAGPTWTVSSCVPEMPVQLVRNVPGDRGLEQLRREVPWSVLRHGDGGWTPVAVLAKHEEESRAEHAARGAAREPHRTDVERIMQESSVSRPTATRMASGEGMDEAINATAFLTAPESYPQDVRRSRFFHDVMDKYRATLAPNEDARSFIASEVRRREEEAELRVAQPPEPTRASAILHTEHERLERSLKRHPIRETIDGLRSARKLVIEHAPTVLDLLERAEGHLDELAGPAFAAWRCDECHRLVPDELLTLVGGHPAVGLINVVLKQGVVAYVECTGDGDGHGPMRHVECRVTASEPEVEGA